ncbi:MAG: hypothetical protein ACOYVK_14820 [Bacillota bacterium]
MLLIVRILYIVLIGFVVYRMFKGGGCCGGGHHGHHGGNSSASHKHDHKPSEIMTEEDKKKAIDISKKNEID